MPLVVPGLMGSNNNDNNEQETWMNKLVGKKLTDDSTSDNTVRNPFSVPRELREEKERERERESLHIADRAVFGGRASQSRTCPRSIGSLSLGAWSRRISSRIGQLKLLRFGGLGVHF